MSSKSIIADNGESHVIEDISDLPATAVESPADGRQRLVDRRNNTTQPGRESGDHINRFLLCALVKESAKLIKERAERNGATLPMSKIVRGVLRSYLLAAIDKYGPLAEAEPDMAGLRRLNDKVLKNELARHMQDGVRSSEERLAHAKRLGDGARISTEQDNLERAVDLRNRIGEEPRR